MAQKGEMLKKGMGQKPTGRIPLDESVGQKPQGRIPLDSDTQPQGSAGSNKPAGSKQGK